VSRLNEQYKNEIIPKLKDELGVANTMSVPKIEKITINMGLGSALGDKKVLESALEELGLISSQTPVTCLARKSVASFKLREGEIRTTTNICHQYEICNSAGIWRKSTIFLPKNYYT
jgi:large subunit ribosomal protein L5